MSSALSTFRPVLVVVAAISSTTANRSVRGRPRQVCVMWQNRRCSILFHFDVPGGIVMDVDHEARRVGELLQFDFPQPHARSIRAAAVGGDRQRARMRISLAPHLIEPAPDRGDGELCRVARDPDADPACVGAQVVHAIRHDLAQFLVLEVVHLHALWIAFGSIVRSAIFVVADQLVSRPAGLHRQSLAERCVNSRPHTAPIRQTHRSF